MNDFETACFGYLENTGLTSYIEFLNMDIFHHIKSSKSVFLVLPLFSWEAVRHTVADTNFPKFQFLFKVLNFIIGNKYCQLFSLKRHAHFVHFQDNNCQTSTSE